MIWLIFIEFAKIDSSVIFGQDTAEAEKAKPTISGEYKRKSLDADINTVSARTASEIKNIESEVEVFVEGRKHLDKDKLG